MSMKNVEVNQEQVCFKKLFRMAPMNFQTLINPILKCPYLMLK